MGDEILETCLSERVFWTPSDAAFESLQLFVDAYQTDVMTSFKFRAADRRYIAKHNEELGKILRYVTVLDLSAIMRLVEDDFLRNIVDFEHLTTLRMDNADLSTSGFRLLLAKHKVYKTGFQKLKIVQLRFSHLSGSNLTTILKFPNLECLSFSVEIFPPENSQDKYDTGYSQRCELAGFRRGPERNEIDEAESTSNKVANVLYDWMDKEHAHNMEQTCQRTRVENLSCLKGADFVFRGRKFYHVFVSKVNDASVTLEEEVELANQDQAAADVAEIDWLRNFYRVPKP